MDRNDRPYARKIYKEVHSGRVYVYIYRNDGIPCLTWAYRIKELYSGREDDRYMNARQIASLTRAVRKARHYLWWRTLASPIYKLFES